MKKQFYFLTGAVVVIVGGILIAAMAGKGPESAVEQYVKAITTGQYDKAKKLATPESAQAINYYHGMMVMAGGSELVKQMQKTKVEIKKIECLTMDETAVCSCSYIVSDDVLMEKGEKKEASEDYNLVKIDGKWYISVKKENMLGGEENADGDGGVIVDPYEIDGDQDFEEIEGNSNTR